MEPTVLAAGRSNGPISVPLRSVAEVRQLVGQHDDTAADAARPRLADLVVPDTLKLAAAAMFEDLKEPTCAAPPYLFCMVEAGLLGREGGRGDNSVLAPPVNEP